MPCGHESSGVVGISFNAHVSDELQIVDLAIFIASLLHDVSCAPLIEKYTVISSSLLKDTKSHRFKFIFV